MGVSVKSEVPASVGDSGNMAKTATNNKAAGGIEKSDNDAAQTDSLNATETVEHELTPWQSQVLDLWNLQNNEYLNGKPYSTHADHKDIPSDEQRVLDYGLKKFAQMENEKVDDGITKESLSEWRIFSHSTSLGARLMLSNFELIDADKSGAISPQELLALNGDDLKLTVHPETKDSAEPPTTEELEAQAGAMDAILARIEQDPTPSHKDFFDTALKGMAKAIVSGDARTLDKMLGTLHGEDVTIGLLANKLDKLFAGTGTSVAQTEDGFRVVGTNGTVAFSMKDRPMSSDMTVSPNDMMRRIGEDSADKDSLESGFRKQDHFAKIKGDFENVSKHLKTDLDTDDGKHLDRILNAVRVGNSVQFISALDSVGERDSAGLNRVANALNQITEGHDLQFSVVSTPHENLFQMRNDKGDKALTLNTRTGRIFFGTNHVTPDITSRSLTQAHQWVKRSIYAGVHDMAAKIAEEAKEKAEP